MKKFLYSLFLKIFFIVFIIIFIGTIFDNKSIFVVENPIYVIISLILITIFFLIVYKVFLKRVDDNLNIKKEIRIVSIIFIVFLIFQVVYAFFLTCHPGWDWHDVMDSARLYVSNSKDSINWEYFQMFPNNNGILYVEIIMFRVLNTLGLLSRGKCIVATVLANIVLIDTSVLFLYLTVRELFDKKKAILSLIMCIFSFAFYCYIPVFYTDTITMLFPILIIFLYVKYNKTNKNKYLVLLTIFSLIGYKIKPTVLIVLIAIVMDLILNKKFKETIKGILYVIASFVVTFSLLYFIEVKFSIFPYDVKNNDKEIPLTHWIMMGMVERDSYTENRKYIGWYDPDSLDLTLSYDTTKERKEANIKQIKKQLKEFGFIDYTTFLYRKALFTWSDGSFFAPILVNADSIIYKHNDTLIRNLVMQNGKYKYITYRQSVGMLLFMYMFMLIGVYKLIKKKDNKFNYIYLSIFGVLLFFLIWEASSRYILNYIPVLILCTIIGFNSIIKDKKNVLEEE